MNTKQQIKFFLGLCIHRQHVEFALYCAKDAVEVSGFKDRSVIDCLNLVAKWLIDPSKVSDKELSEAAYSAAYNAHSAYSAAYSAAHSAYSANSAYSAYSAAYSASSAAYSASSAANSAAFQAKQEEQLAYLITHIISISDFDKLIYEC